MNGIFEHVIDEIRVRLYKVVENIEHLDLFLLLFVELDFHHFVKRVSEVCIFGLETGQDFLPDDTHEVLVPLDDEYFELRVVRRVDAFLALVG